MTVVLDGVAVTLAAGDRDSAVASSVVLDLRPSQQLSNDPDSMVAFFGAHVGDFADLAAVVSRSAGVDRSSRAGPTVHLVEVSCLAEFSARNQAIGVLVERGRTRDAARLEVQRRATSNAETLKQTAQEILDNLTGPAVSTALDPLGLTAAMANPDPDPTPKRAGRRPRTRPNNALAPRMRRPTSPARTGSPRGADLTAPERAVLRLIIAGSSTPTIAAALRLLPGTVTNHAHAIMVKLGAHSRVEPVAICLSSNIRGSARPTDVTRRTRPAAGRWTSC